MSTSDRSNPLTYRDAGVDIDAGDALVENIKPFARKTMRPEVLAGIGGFGALCRVPGKYREPVLVSGTDGVGTKLKLAFELDRHDTIGIDLVAMSVNDILVQGAEPLFFLDYFACGKLDVEAATEVIKGIAFGCEQVGVVEKSRIIDGSTIAAGDAVLGLASSGAHSNGYSLIRRIIAQNKIDLSAQLDGRTLSDLILAPTRIYVKPVLQLMEQLPVKGLAHITGGGLVDNVPRILPAHLTARLERASWRLPPLFEWLRQQGNVADDEMLHVFNCGIGMVVIVAAEHARQADEVLRAAGETAWRIGTIQARAAGEAQTTIVA